MSARFEELDWQQTSMGELSLRRRRDPSSGVDVYEVKLGDEFLMSSLFTVAEVELARLALGELDATGRTPTTEAPTGVGAADGTTGLRVVVGGLGLGCTAAAVLDHPGVVRLAVVDALPEVIGWHQRGLVPLGDRLAADPRCHLVHGDFFRLAMDGALATALTGRRDGTVRTADHAGAAASVGGLDAVVVDIDHSPRHLLDPAHAEFYGPAGALRVAEQLSPRGVFALWSNDPPDEEYMDVVRGSFGDVRADVVRFDNPLRGGTSTNTVYVATRPSARPA